MKTKTFLQRSARIILIFFCILTSIFLYGSYLFISSLKKYNLEFSSLKIGVKNKLDLSFKLYHQPSQTSFLIDGLTFKIRFAGLKPKISIKTKSVKINIGKKAVFLNLTNFLVQEFFSIKATFVKKFKILDLIAFDADSKLAEGSCKYKLYKSKNLNIEELTCFKVSLNFTKQNSKIQANLYYNGTEQDYSSGFILYLKAQIDNSIYEIDSTLEQSGLIGLSIKKNAKPYGHLIRKSISIKKTRSKDLHAYWNIFLNNLFFYRWEKTFTRFSIGPYKGTITTFKQGSIYIIKEMILFWMKSILIKMGQKDLSCSQGKINLFQLYQKPLLEPWMIHVDFLKNQFSLQKIYNLFKSPSNELLSITGQFFIKDQFFKTIMNFSNGVIHLQGQMLNEKLNCKSSIKNLILHSDCCILDLTGNFQITLEKDPSILINGNLSLNRGFIKLQNLSQQKHEGLTPTYLKDFEQILKTTPLSIKTNIKTKKALDLELDNDFKINIKTDLKCLANQTKDFKDILFQGNIFCKSTDFIFANRSFSNAEILCAYKNNSIFDPIVSFKAQSLIKCFNVDLYGFGVKDSFIFSATSEPKLSEEQIFSLLLTGVPDKKIGFKHLFSKTMSAFQSGINLQDFWTNKKNCKTAQMHIYPCLSSSSSAGLPMHTSVVIDLSNRFFATVEKYLSDKDDLNVSVEYLFSKNVSLKFQRSEEGLIRGLVDLNVSF